MNILNSLNLNFGNTTGILIMQCINGTTLFKHLENFIDFVSSEFVNCTDKEIKKAEKIKNYNFTITNKLRYITDALNELNICNLDNHLNNYMYDSNDDKIYMIDFEFCGDFINHIPLVGGILHAKLYSQLTIYIDHGIIKRDDDIIKQDDYSTKIIYMLYKSKFNTDLYIKLYNYYTLYNLLASSLLCNKEYDEFANLELHGFIIANKDLLNETPFGLIS